MCRTACTELQCLYKGAPYLIISARGSHCNYSPQIPKDQLSNSDVFRYGLQNGHVAVVPDQQIWTVKISSWVPNNVNYIASHCRIGRYPPFSKVTNALRVNRGTAVLFSRIFRTRWGGVVSPTPRPPLPPWKNRYPFYRRLGGPQGRSGRAENLVPTGIRSQDRPARSSVVYRLSYRAHQLSSNAVNYVYYYRRVLS